MRRRIDGIELNPVEYCHCDRGKGRLLVQSHKRHRRCAQEGRIHIEKSDQDRVCQHINEEVLRKPLQRTARICARPKNRAIERKRAKHFVQEQVAKVAEAKA